MSVWDAMLLHDVKNYEKEQDRKKATQKNNQKQLKAYLDKQVDYIKNKQKVEKHKELNEFNNMVSITTYSY